VEDSSLTKSSGNTSTISDPVNLDQEMKRKKE